MLRGLRDRQNCSVVWPLAGHARLDKEVEKVELKGQWSIHA